MKKKCAAAALERIHDDMTVGLGGGETIGYLIGMIAEKGLRIKVVTPSFSTAQKCLEAGLELIPVSAVQHIDIAFDGCDEADRELCALKSTGGIHTKEKIVASLAQEYILLIDEAKLFDKLPFAHKVVLEVLPDAYRYVKNVFEQKGITAAYRKSSAKDGLTITDQGNYLLDVKIDAPADSRNLERSLKQITGVVETSIFTDQISSLICAHPNEIENITRRI